MPDIDPKTDPRTAGSYAKTEQNAQHRKLAEAYRELAAACDANSTAEILRIKKAIYEIERGERKGVALWDLDKLLKFQPDPHDEIISGGILYAAETASIIGPPGIGKSRVVLQMAIHVILGRDLFGWRTNAPGKKWLFLQTENTARRLKYDLERMLRGLSRSQMDTLRECLLIMDVEADESGTIYLTGSDRRRIEDTVLEHDPAVVCADPLSDTTTDDLNMDVHMSAAAAALKQVTRIGNPKRLPFIVHHAKPGTVEAAKVFGDESATYARNSKRLLGAVRSQINMAAAGDAHPNIIIVGCGKFSNGPKWAPFAAELDESTMLYHRLDESEFDLEQWAEETKGGGTKKGKGATRNHDVASPEVIAGLVREAGGRVKGGVNDKEGLVHRVQQVFNLQRRPAQEAVERATGETIIRVEEQRAGKGKGSAGGKTVFYELKAA